MPWTNRGQYRRDILFFRNESSITTFYLALCSDATTPTADINTLGELTEVPAGNGYTSGGIAVARSAVGFDVATENDTDDRSEIQMADVVWSASGGDMPSSGGARWAVLTDDNGTVANRDVLAWLDLGGNRTVSDTQSLTVRDAEFRGLFQA